ncbi:leucine-rich repeat-containing protein 15 [Parasteatoda tepidariorum]|uniref:leucine-rich repeat-containing protein 15 n=1 Tax=Parasteatoda tepidariorum TaxID=114398 RepID=UPI0039BC2371
MTVSKIQVIILFASAAVAISTNCPPSEDTWPCSCHDKQVDADITLYCSDRDTNLGQLKKALNTLKTKRNVGVELEEVKLGRVPFDFFKGIDIKYLHLSHCDLDTLADGGGKPLTGLEDSLEELVISSSFTEDNVPAKLVVSHLRTLRELDLTNNIITNLDNDWFKNAPSSLRRLSITNNGIQKVGDRAFSDISNLEYLSLSGNRFGTLARSMLPNPANELDTLELDNNALRSLPDNFFNNIPYLKVVSLSSNGINKLPEKVWRPVWNKLDDIDLRRNPLDCDSHMNWMLQVPTCADISATCMSPRQKFRKNIPFVKCT